MRGPIWVWGIAACVAVAAMLPGEAAMPSKQYVFKPHVELKIGAELRDDRHALRLETVQFRFPDRDRVIRFGDAVQCDVSISNLGTEAVKVGVAIAAFDAEGNLLGVASGGSKWMPIKPDRRSYYTVRFTDVNDRMDEASSFQITLEPK
jgi:hypothetical protein